MNTYEKDFEGLRKLFPDLSYHQAKTVLEDIQVKVQEQPHYHIVVRPKQGLVRPPDYWSDGYWTAPAPANEIARLIEMDLWRVTCAVFQEA